MTIFLASPIGSIAGAPAVGATTDPARCSSRSLTLFLARGISRGAAKNAKIYAKWKDDDETP
jgi:hypothetical protein